MSDSSGTRPEVKAPELPAGHKDTGSVRRIISVVRNISLLEWMLPPGKEVTFDEGRKRTLFAALIRPGTFIVIICG
jgi:hypothetical protein